MLIVLFLVLCVDLAVVVAVAVLVSGCRRWLNRQPAGFASGGAAIEVAARAGCRTLVTGPMTVDVT